MVAGDKETDLFFKIVLPPVLHDKTLKIPPKFVKEFSKELSSMATLVLPTGKRWTVSLHCEGNEFWFRDGLNEFFEFNSIECGYFLVFSYRGDSEFGVRIFDLSACEISYPVSDANCTSDDVDDPNYTSVVDHHDDPSSVFDDDTNSVSDDDDDSKSGSDDDIVVLDKSKLVHNVIEVVELSSGDDSDVDDQQYVNVNNKITRPITRKRKMEFEISSSDVKIRPDDHQQNVESPKETKKIDRKSKRSTPAPVADSNKTKTKNPLFEAVIKPYNIGKDLFIVIPTNIGRRYPTGGSGLVKLEISDGRTWMVRGILERGRLRSLSEGWGDFARDTNLKVGNRCVFELIKSDKDEFTMKVSKFNK